MNLMGWFALRLAARQLKGPARASGADLQVTLAMARTEIMALGIYLIWANANESSKRQCRDAHVLLLLLARSSD